MKHLARRRFAAGALATSIALVAFGTLQGCGGGDDDISGTARDQLTPIVASVRQAATSSDPYGAALALADVRKAVATLHDHGAIGDSRAYDILAAVARVESRLALVPTTTTTTTTTTPTSIPPPANDHGKGKGKGKGKD